MVNLSFLVISFKGASNVGETKVKRDRRQTFGHGGFVDVYSAPIGHDLILKLPIVVEARLLLTSFCRTTLIILYLLALTATHRPSAAQMKDFHTCTQ